MYSVVAFKRAAIKNEQEIHKFYFKNNLNGKY